MPADASTPRGPLAFLLTSTGWPYLLVPFIPIAIVLELLHAGPVVLFATSALGRDPDGRADGPRDRGAGGPQRARASAAC